MYTVENHPDRNFWVQIKKRIDAPRDEDTGAVILSKKQFDDLDDYSMSNPTGIYVGKVWKRQILNANFERWMLCRYHNEAGSIDTFEIVIKDDLKSRLKKSDEMPVWLL